MVEMIKYVEKWLPITIDNVKQYYTISTYGRIFNNLTNSFMQPQVNHNGYLFIGLTTHTGRVHRKIHRLVMMTFCYIPGCENLQVNHKDLDKTNNTLWNLEWVTAKENIHHAIINNARNTVGENNPRSIITENEAKRISNLILLGYSNKQISNIIGCSQRIVKNIAYGKCWSYLFDDKCLNEILLTRNYMSDEIKHAICKFFQDNKEINYGTVKNLCIFALQNANFEINDKSLRIAKRLYYRYQNPDITNLYLY